MKLNKIILHSLTFTSISMISFSALASPGFFIGNNTSSVASVKVNHGKCSTRILGSSGLFKAKVVSGFDDITIGKLCGNTSANCMIDIYMTKNCKGPSVVTVAFDQNTGIVSLDVNKNNTGFTVTKQAERTVGIGQVMN